MLNQNLKAYRCGSTIWHFNFWPSTSRAMCGLSAFSLAGPTFSSRPTHEWILIGRNSYEMLPVRPLFQFVGSACWLCHPTLEFYTSEVSRIGLNSNGLLSTVLHSPPPCTDGGAPVISPPSALLFGSLFTGYRRLCIPFECFMAFYFISVTAMGEIGERELEKLLGTAGEPKVRPHGRQA